MGRLDITMDGGFKPVFLSATYEKICLLEIISKVQVTNSTEVIYESCLASILTRLMEKQININIGLQTNKCH